MKKTMVDKIVSHALGCALALFLGMAVAGVPVAGASDVTAHVSVLKGEKNFLNDYDPHNLDGTINAVIEIPAGTTAKYEVNKGTGMLELEQRDGSPRYVQYLGYPCNYGLIPRTVLLKEKGGDGDAVDVCVLGPAVPIGSVVKTRILGLLNLLDGGEVDDKVILVLDNSPFAVCKSMEDLDARFPGVTTILKTWFTSYKGRDKAGKLKLSSTGFKGRAEAIRFVGDAILDFEKARVTEADKRPLDKDGNPLLYRWPGSRNIGE
jgi:inorganic pyrophosphatase